MWPENSIESRKMFLGKRQRNSTSKWLSCLCSVYRGAPKYHSPVDPDTVDSYAFLILLRHVDFRPQGSALTAKSATSNRAHFFNLDTLARVLRRYLSATFYSVEGTTHPVVVCECSPQM